MFLQRLATAAVVVLSLVGCGERSVTVSEVTFSDEKVYVDGKPYTGTVWSDDKHTWELTSSEGIPTAVTFYHDGGQAAYIMDSSADTADMRTFDEGGTRIPADTFAERYKDLASQIPALLRLLKGEINDN